MGSDGEPLRGRHREAEGGELGRRGEGWGGHLETSTARGGERMEGEGQGQGGQGSSSPRSRDSQLVETTGTKAAVGQPVRAAGVTCRQKEHAQLGIWKVKKEIVFSGNYRKYCFTKSRWWQYPGQGLGPLSVPCRGLRAQTLDSDCWALNPQLCLPAVWPQAHFPPSPCKMGTITALS